MDNNKIIQDQINYYRARASEYDEWFMRVGRYDQGEERNRQWFTEAAQVRDLLLRHAPVERALELAAGTGIWTQELVKIAGHVTALDAASEVIAINRAKLPDANVTYEQADLFVWQPDALYDLVFFGFWLSHVPPELLDGFMAKVAQAARRGGTVFMIDSRRVQHSTAKDNPIPQAGTTITRNLNDGSAFTIVKIFYEPDDLRALFARHGFRADVRTSEYFIYAQATKG